MHDQIVRDRFQCDNIVISNDLCLGPASENLRKSCHDGRKRKPSVNLVESLLKVSKSKAMQEQRVVMARKRARSGSVARKGCQIGQGGW